MSEYQYYEFQAVDRPLTPEQQREVRAVSSRARITPTRWANVYNYGDFRGDPLEFMERYYDAHLYLANWGTREVTLRVHRQLLDPALAARYCPGHAASAEVRGEWVILSFRSEREEDTWTTDGSGRLSAILPLREEIARGDLRALYLGWLLWAQYIALDEDEPYEDGRDEDEPDEDGPEPPAEPPVPPGLGKPSAALKAFASFLRIDRDLIRTAAERSPALEEEPGEEAFGPWVAALPEDEKTALLLRALNDEALPVRAELLRRFRLSRRGAPPASSDAPRTVPQLLAAAERRTEARLRAEAERAAREKARREREEAERREKYLDELAGREEETWKRAEALVSLKQAQAYDEAVALLRDLRDLAARGGRASEAEARIRALRAEHARKSTFVQRLDRMLAKR